ncbi:MAG: hypothetical protein CMQ40_11595 [Gammaproteobacteria bacterium]|nr:hypothetical protein [Gammaproteobacteria bacterium]
MKKLSLLLPIICSFPAHADFSRGKTYQPSNSIDLMEQRTEYKRALDLLKTNQFTKFSKTKPKLKNYILYPYLDYKEKIYRISRFKEKDILKFVGDYSDTPLTQPLIEHWLRNLARRGHWKTFLRNYDKRKKPSRELECHRSYALYKKSSRKEGLEKAAQLWTVGFSQPKECDPVFYLLNSKGEITADRAWTRLGLSIKANERQLAKYLLRYIDQNRQKDAANYRLVHSRPSTIRNIENFSSDSPSNREVVLHGINRLSRTNPAIALKLMNEYRKKLKFKDNALEQTYRKIGISLARMAKDYELIESLPIKLRAHPDLVEARIRQSLRLKDWGNAIVLINLLPEEEKKSQKWRYWKARVLDFSGDPADRRIAHSIYQELSEVRSYYGFLSADIIGSPYNYQHQISDISFEETKKLENIPGIKRSLELFALGERSKARQEWYLAVSGFSETESKIASRLAIRWGWHKASIQTMIMTESWDNLDERFPTAYKDVFTKYARQKNLPVEWSLAVARQESAFMPDAKSRAGARGLMQLMPSTARLVAKGIGTSYSKNRRLLEIDLNIKLGTTYLRWMLDRYNNNRILASAAYNAGPGNVDKWINPQVPFDVWIEIIPFPETRNYVKNVLAFSAIYSYLLNQEAPLIYIAEKKEFESASAINTGSN